MLSIVKFGMPCFLGVGSLGMVGSNWVFKQEEILLINSDNKEDWDPKVKDLFKKIKAGDSESLKTQIATTGEHSDSLETADDNNNNFKHPEKARVALKAWCQSKKDSSEEVVTELCKEKQLVGWLFRNQVG